jgi:hypothetical protein
MTRSPRPREAVSLPDSVHRRLNMYVLVASAAGLGSYLALVQPSTGRTWAGDLEARGVCSRRTRRQLILLGCCKIAVTRINPGRGSA